MPDNLEGIPPEEYINKFYEELHAIQLNTASMRTDSEDSVPSLLKEILKLNQAMVDVFKGETGSASRGAGIDPAKLGAGGSASNAPGISEDQKLAQKLLGPNAEEGQHASKGTGWLERAEANKKLRIPQIGELTGQDLFEYISNTMATMANKVRQKTPEYKNFEALEKSGAAWAKDDQGEFIKDPETGGRVFSEQGRQAAEELQNLPGGGGGFQGRASEFMAGAATGYAQGKAISDIVRKVANPIMRARDLGYLTGYTGPANQGPLGMVMPWNAAARAGWGQKLSEFGFAMNNNLSPGQATAIYNNLFGLGWNGGQQTDVMRQGLAQITQANPIMGTSPEVAAMMDQATRMGQNSVKQFVETMKQIPQAADSAHVSLVQMIHDAQSLGTLNQQMGGTFLGGVQGAQMWSQATGLPASVYGTMVQNPLVQGMTFMQSGLMPYMQGLATPLQHTQGIVSAVNMLAGAVGQSFPQIKTTDAAGIPHIVTRQAQQEAAISHLMPGTSPALIHRILTNQQGMLAGMQIGQVASDYRDQVLGTLSLHKQFGSKYDPNALQNLQGQTWTKVQALMQSAVDPDTGKKLFSQKDIDTLNNMGNKPTLPEFEKWQKYEAPGIGGKGGDWANKEWGLHPNWDPGDPKDQMKLMQLAIDQGKWKPTKVPSEKEMGDIARKRAQFIQSKLGKATQDKGPQIQIELGPAAKKILHLSTVTGSGKASAGAGGSQVNIPYSNGPSDMPLFADPNTAGAGGSTWGTTSTAGIS